MNHTPTPDVTTAPERVLRLPGSAAIGPSFIRDVCQNRLPADGFDEAARDRAMRTYLIATMYPSWSAARCLALADELGIWTLVDDVAEFRPSSPESFWARWEGK